MKIRLMRESDINNSFVECLEQLGKTQTKLTDMHAIYKSRKKSGIKTFVVEVAGDILATASLIIEPKFRYTEKCGHIEDVCVHKNYQNIGIGKKLINHLIQYGKKKGCYKLILNCNDKTLPFYEKLNYSLNGHSLRLDLI